MEINKDLEKLISTFIKEITGDLCDISDGTTVSCGHPCSCEVFNEDQAEHITTAEKRIETYIKKFQSMGLNVKKEDNNGQ